MKSQLIVNCPNCNKYIIIEQLNCAIFRCGIYKENYQQIPPHLGQNECEDLVKQRLIYGCGQPFRIIDGIAERCKWI
jgi:hypothetical protein